MSISTVLPQKEVTDAARALNCEMSRISEDHYCAGWMMGLELSLWELMMRGGGGYGMGWLMLKDAEYLCRLAHAAGGWWYWPEREGFLLTDEEQFTDLASWQTAYDEYLRWYVLFRRDLRRLAR